MKRDEGAKRDGRLMAEVATWAAAFRLIRAASPRLTAVWLCLLIVQGVLPATVVYVVKLLIDRLVGSGAARFSWDMVPVVLPIAALAGALLLAVEVLQSVVEWVR